MLNTNIGPSFIRRNNVRKILDLLIEEPLSNLELAQKIEISGAAVNKILKQLSSLRIIQVVPDNFESNQVGRKSIRYRISDETGLYVLLDLTQHSNVLIIKNYSGKRIFRKKYVFDTSEYDFISEENILEVIKDIKTVEIESGLPVYVISISTPGQYDNVSNAFILSRKFDNIAKDFLYKALREEFDSKIIVKNNVQMMAIGEYEYGNLKSEYNTSLYVYIGMGLAASSLYKDQIITGWRGYAGEIAHNRFSLDKYLSFASVQKLINHFKDELETADLKGIVNAYFSNPKIEEFINNSALAIAEAILNISNIIGNDVVVISGEALMFGEKYIETIRNFVNKYSIPKMKIYTSDSNHMNLLGCEVLARRYINENILELKESYSE